MSLIFYISLSFELLTTIRSKFILKYTDRLALAGVGEELPFEKDWVSRGFRLYKSGLGNSYRVFSLKMSTAESFAVPFTVLN